MKKTKGRLASNVGARLRDLRHQAKLTQGDVAQRARLTAKYISELENGHRDIKLSTLERLAKAVKADPGELLRFAPADVTSSRIAAMLSGRDDDVCDHVIELVRDALRLADVVKP